MRRHKMNFLTDALDSLYNYFTSEALWLWIGKTLLRIAIIIIFAYILNNIENKVIDTIFKDKKKVRIKLTTNRREQTLRNLSKNILSYVIMFKIGRASCRK